VLLALVLAACAMHVLPQGVPPIPLEERSVSLFLIGDAGKPRAGDRVLGELAAQGAAAPRGSTIVFLGDNLYPRGLPPAGDPERAEMERRLDIQLDAVKRSGLHAVFVPGNHDWADAAPGGWDAVLRAQEFIRARGDGLAVQSPGGGCPGPEVVDVGGGFRLLLLDTQWWLHDDRYPKPRDPSSACPADSEVEVRERLERLLSGRGGRRVIVAGHHPLATAGEHGGRFSLTTHLFPLRTVKRWLWIPLPILGSLYPIARANGITEQDMSGRSNRHMRESLGSAMVAHPPLLYAAGHEHALQVFRGPYARYSVVSGAGIEHHQTRVGWRDSTLFASSSPGFMRLDLDRSGRVRLSVTAVEEQGAREVLGFWLSEP